VWFLIIPVVAFVAANCWLVWTGRTPRAPEVDQTIEAHRRFAAAMERTPRRRRLRLSRR
jgi:hypothetical protein